ncbi:MAG TPA: IPT/TIG domain-containing protein, partial [Polyangiaceae bacterium]|nr:IPT/TIG domain-containing protein [Polyangiaceae bacterium]
VVQNGDDRSTRVSLRGGFAYDDLTVEPSNGPTSGGTLVTVRANEPIFTDETRIDVDLVPCEVESVESATELTCKTPAGTPGSKRVRATLEDGTEIDVLDAFTYVVSDNGFRGGLSGDPLDGSLEVLVLDTLTGLAVRGATVLVGPDAETALTATTDRYGTALVADDQVGTRATVTVAKSCYQPTTFVDVPVDKVTVYLLPTPDPACGGEGDPPAGGGNPGRGASVSGEVVWRLGGEFRREGFSNVPGPSGVDEHQVAYVFRLSSQPTDDFSLPSAVYAVTPESTGNIGYSFSFSTSPGNFTLYALAGIEDRSTSPYRFTPYAVGITRGVVATDYNSRGDVFIEVDVPLDHALTLDARGPTATERGPDRVEGRLAIEVGGEGYLILPNGVLTATLPVTDPLRFVGVPPLWGSLTGSRYIATARAYTGKAGSLPRSSVGLFASTTEDTIGVGAFVEIPKLVAPASSADWDGTLLRLDREPGGAVPDLTVIDVAGSGGLSTWRIVAPGAPDEVRVPDLRVIDRELALGRGPIVIQVTAARADDFEYGTVRYRQLAERGWRAFAQDAFFANY